MFGHKSFLVLGGDISADIKSLAKGGYEIFDYDFSLDQGIDRYGKATTRVYGGTINVTLSQLPPHDIIEWGMKSRKYRDGAIVVLDAELIPLQKIIFQNAACVNLEINYTHTGDTYTMTKIEILAEKLTMGNGVQFENEWTEQ